MFRLIIKPKRIKVLTRQISYRCNQKELSFILNDVLKVPEVYQSLDSPYPHLLDSHPMSRDTINSLIEECSKFAEQELLPIRQDLKTGGEATCIFNEKNPVNPVSTPPGWKQAYKLYSDNGWQGLSVPEEYGGQGFPNIFSLMRSEITATANWGWSMYPGLTSGAVNTLLAHASEEQKTACIPNLTNGKWTGTMCLTEPHCGSDLGQMLTTATPIDDPKLTAIESRKGPSFKPYKLNGTKIFISCGEHDMAENIIHIVLARLPDSPPGTKGISLFIVPKFLPGIKQNIQCTRIENKMGIHGSSTCEILLEDSIGYLIGKPNDGLRQMFTFMNTARIGTALQGLTTMELSYQNAVPYAKDRIAFRSLSGTKYPDNKNGDPIIVHPDVRRMLLTIRSIMEPARAWLYSTAMEGDLWQIKKQKAEDNPKSHDDRLGFQTPILKGFLTEIGQEASSNAIQIWGGHGYIVENGIEQIYRDSRISTLYEGTTGIQALDLLGRKIMVDRGKLLNKHLNEITSYCGYLFWSKLNTSGLSILWELSPLIGKLLSYTVQWRAYSYLMMYRASNNKDIVGSGSYDYLMYSGYVNIAYWWVKLLETSHEKETEEQFQTRLKLANFYFNRVLPRADAHAKIMKQGPTTITALADEKF